MTCDPINTYIYVILVDGAISRDGFFPEEELEEAQRVLKRYQKNYKASIKRVKQYQRDLT